ncbi:hypothetical protein [Chryseobacterium indologenes]|uniref:hypothetical protein n=1 Tax=Chryseobacterium indologenes TaxID=253 RepID=UPI001BD090D1|nr:hypothetical protein [Chryseobacterium indologenes]
MKKNLIFRLFLPMVLFTMFHSCIHDETLASSDPASKEYTNKSLWKEDEKYIMNVMKIYHDNEFKIKKSNGTPYWNYATTVDQYDESFLMVPVVENGKVVSVLQVPRHQDKVYFVYTFSKPDLLFFQNLLSSRLKKTMKTMSDETGKLTCSTLTYSVWHPDSESNSDPSSGSGHWETYHVTRCSFSQITECVGIVGPDGECNEGGGGYDYPTGGGTGNNPPDPPNPCDKMKTQNADPNFKAKVSSLDKSEIFDKSQETGFAAAYGTQPFEQMSNTSDGNVRLPDGNKYFGYMHSHLNLDGVVKIFSPYDIVTFLTSCVTNAKLKGSMTDAYAMVITSQGNYILKYSGDGNFAITNGQLNNWQTWYRDEYSKLKDSELSNSNIVEKIFTQFLEEQVKINGLEVYKSDKTTGDTSKLNYNGKDNPIQTIPCP